MLVDSPWRVASAAAGPGMVNALGVGGSRTGSVSGSLGSFEADSSARMEK